MLPKDKMMKGASPLKFNQGTNVRQQKIVLASPKFFSHGETTITKKQRFGYANIYSHRFHRLAQISTD